jgi:methionine sulfoxide reductase heme-binding subunit
MAGWYLARGTGAATLVLLTLTLVLGIVNVRRWAPRGLQRFVVDDLHRTLGLLVVVVLGVHIASNVLDDFVSISLIDALVPFVGSYHPFWLGLGALSLDLLAALIVTSLLRARIGVRAWRAVHWVAYACWPVAVAHGIGMGTDASGWLLWMTIGCGALVAVAVAARLTQPRTLEVAS